MRRAEVLGWVALAGSVVAGMFPWGSSKDTTILVSALYCCTALLSWSIAGINDGGKTS